MGSEQTRSPSAEELGSAGAGIDIHDLVRALGSRRWLMAVTFAAAVLPVVLYVLAVTPVYQARTQLLIEPAEVTGFERGPGGNERDLTSYYQTQYEILESRTLARRTLDELDLWNADLSGPTFSSYSWLGRLLGAVLPSGKFTSPGPVGRADAETLAVTKFLKHLTISYQVDTHLVDVVFECHDPELAARVVNTLARIYAQHNVELRSTPFKEAIDLFDGRLAEQRRRVEQSEQALQQYIEENGDIDLGGTKSFASQRVEDVASALSQATTDRMRLQVTYEQLQASSRQNMAPSMLTNSLVQDLRANLADQQQRLAELLQRYGDLHPRVVEIRAAIEAAEHRLQDEMGAVVQAARADYLAAQEREQRLDAELEQLQGAELVAHRKGISYRALEQEVATNRTILNTLMTRARETSLSSELTPSQISVLDAAEVPQSPIRPQKKVIVGLAALFALMVSVGVALFLEYGLDRVRSADTLLMRVGLRPLGSLPIRKPGVPNEQWRARFFESMRAIRTTALARIGRASLSSSIVVTSAVPGEGKTTTAWTLATVLAEADWATQRKRSGRKPVLLVDADMRVPRLHEIFRLSQGPGLAEVIAGTATLDQVVRRSPFPGVFIITAGVPKVNPGAALGTARFGEILRALNQYFDWVVVDTPPVMAVGDAVVIGRHGASVLMVVDADATPTSRVRNAVGHLRDGDVAILGAVLNRVNPDRHPYANAPTYYAEYGAHYAPYGGQRSA